MFVDVSLCHGVVLYQDSGKIYMGGSKDVIIGMEGDNENNVIKLKFKRLQPAVQLPVGSICLRREAACRRRT